MIWRIGSPSGRSTLTTSAPQSPRAAAADGTNPCSEKSRTLMPVRGSVTGGETTRCPGSGEDLTAVYVDGLPGDRRGQPRGEVDDGPGHFVVAGDPAEGDLGRELGDDVLARDRPALGRHVD